jgi:hypothetical protein
MPEEIEKNPREIKSFRDPNWETLEVLPRELTCLVRVYYRERRERVSKWG